MPSKITGPVLALVMASLSVGIDTGQAVAGTGSRKTVVVVPARWPLYAPYYYSRWNPYSLYSVYDHLSGGRQLCYLPSEPCDNNHRMQN
jgi:hypothetical protein